MADTGKMRGYGWLAVALIAFVIAKESGLLQQVEQDTEERFYVQNPGQGLSQLANGGYPTGVGSNVLSLVESVLNPVLNYVRNLIPPAGQGGIFNPKPSNIVSLGPDVTGPLPQVNFPGSARIPIGSGRTISVPIPGSYPPTIPPGLPGTTGIANETVSVGQMQQQGGTDVLLPGTGGSGAGGQGIPAVIGGGGQYIAPGPAVFSAYQVPPNLFGYGSIAHSAAYKPS